MSETRPYSFEDAEVEFENSPAKIVFLKSLEDFKILDITIEDVKEGTEYEVAYWIASELVKTGLARFHDESTINATTLYKIHWRETKLQTGRQISSLPAFFYPQTRRYLKQLKEKAVSDSAAANEYNNTSRLIQDIVDCRLKKIVSIATSSAQIEVLRGLSREERILYEYFHLAMLDWKSKILSLEE